ncbi:HlyD family type I secretion periplasmic adaptor subunit [Chelativorans sp. AA-79]|uniref:HlyD family type I secretion periplasmic adaptor subunit n=1 Tax=Chelativorans sp. AA-79 TaxID=3028735 RepID=UPI0023FA4169|nr:HlyD family type I secretion periplasmic adaptor subunit [Chelativorans sp. AA-79]WEX08260.1 HlyD family type I secretion periplasmic adaptor subunit [Chelativorans sp. AA-79]
MAYEGDIGWGAEFGALKKGSLRRPVLWLAAFTIAAFFIWAANAPLAEVTRGTGKVTPSSRVQVIQSLDGGILQHITVQEGEEVRAGQVLATLEDTRSRSAYQDLEGQVLALRAALSRLAAEQADQDSFRVPADVASHEEVVAVERELFEARRRNLAETTASFEERLALARRELELATPLVAKGAVSTADEIKLQRNVADLRGQLTETRTRYFQEVNEEIAKKSGELSSLQQQLAERRSALARTELKSPVRGIVKKLEITTQGGVVQPGETIMEIVPLDEALYVEARIRPRDVAFLYPGLPATVRITAYDSAIYGTLDGELVFISADTIVDQKPTQQHDAEPYYMVRVRTEQSALEGPDGSLPIKPGMVAEVAIQTGSKTVLSYLLKPLLRGQEALGER